jgi:glutathione S-transferase
VDQTLAKSKKPWLLGDNFSVADAYLFVMTSWAGHVGIDLQGLTKVTEYSGRVRERPAVAAALRAEGLAK